MGGPEDVAAPMPAGAPGASAAPVEATTASTCVGQGQDGAGANEAAAAVMDDGRSAPTTTVASTGVDEESASDEDEGSGSGSSDEDEGSEAGVRGGGEPLVDDLAMAALAAGLDDVVCGALTSIAAYGVVSASPVGLPVPEVVEEENEGAGRLLEIAKEIERVRGGRNEK